LTREGSHAIVRAMADDLQTRAEALFEEALAARGARDPRDYYRERLKALKEQDRDAYDRAVAHYKEALIPSIADGGVDPLAAWTEYGHRLAELSTPGRTVALDATGRAHAYEAPADPAHLVLHLPDSPRGPTLLVGLPTELSAAQRAAYLWLVQGRNSLDASS
jgi:hypothetical protein